MALYIDGDIQYSLTIDGVALDRLYIDGVLVWSLDVDTPPTYEMTEPLITE